MFDKLKNLFSKNKGIKLPEEVKKIKQQIYVYGTEKDTIVFSGDYKQINDKLFEVEPFDNTEIFDNLLLLSQTVGTKVRLRTEKNKDPKSAAFKTATLDSFYKEGDKVFISIL